MTKLLLLVLTVSLCGSIVSRAQDKASLNLVVAIDLSRSMAVVGPDGKSEFQKNVDGVAQLLSRVPAGARVTVIGITDHSFTQPYILLRAQVPDDPGYFGDRLNSARRQIVAAWKVRSGKLTPQFPMTDIFGVLALAQQVFTRESVDWRRELVIFSDMRESTPDLDFEGLDTVPSFQTLFPRCGILPELRGVEIEVLGVDGAGKSTAYWQSLQAFWQGYLRRTGASLREYSTLRDRPLFPTLF